MEDDGRSGARVGPRPGDERAHRSRRDRYRGDHRAGEIGAQAMTNNLFIGGFPYETTEAQLAALFGRCGTVLKVKILLERDTGRSRGLAFVEMGTPAEA